MKFTKSDSSEKSTEQKGIKRRNFLGYLGISAVGVFLLSKLPGKLFSSSVNSAVSQKKPSIIVKENQLAVKRVGKNRDVKNNG